MAVSREDWEGGYCDAHERCVAGEKWQCRMEIPKIEDPTGGTKVGPVGITLNKVHQSPVKNTWFHIRESVPSPFLLWDCPLLYCSCQIAAGTSVCHDSGHYLACVSLQRFLFYPGSRGWGSSGHRHVSQHRFLSYPAIFLTEETFAG